MGCLVHAPQKHSLPISTIRVLTSHNSAPLHHIYARRDLAGGPNGLTRNRWERVGTQRNGWEPRWERRERAGTTVTGGLTGDGRRPPEFSDVPGLALVTFTEAGVEPLVWFCGFNEVAS